MESILVAILVFLAVVMFGNRPSKKCPKCGNKMTTWGVVGDGAGPAYDHRLWDCPKCNYTEEELIQG